MTQSHVEHISALLADRYRLERELGAGGMATVYLAEDLKHHRQVAIKVLRAELSAVLGPERFLKEIELTASLQHPHILPLFDSGSAEGLLYYVMPFVDGETLRARLEREKQLPIAEAVRIAGEVADALHYAHERGVIHRDIKPENVLLQNGHALVADFGIALAVEQAGGQRMTQTGLSLGTPQYMSPEQAMGERAVDARSDIYSLGAVTYEMLAGEPPFTGPTAQAIVAQVITEDPPGLTARRRSVPPHVDDAVRTALQKLPADRFGTATEFASALTTPSFRSRTAGTGRPRGWRRHRATVATGAVAVIALVAAVWGWARAAGGVDRTGPLAAAGVRPWLATLAFPDSAPPVGTFALSPDGSRLVYVARGPHGTQLWVRDADALDPHPLPGTDSASHPAVSPDGSEVAFLAGRSLRVVSPAGGPVTTVTDTLPTFSLIGWSDNGHLFVSSRSGLMRVPLHGGPWEQVTTYDTPAGEVFHTGASALPGGEAILFVVVPRNYGDNAGFRIAVSDPATGRHRALLPGFWARYVDPGYLLVVRPDSALVAVPFDAERRRLTGAPVPLAAGVTVDEDAFPRIAVARTGQLVYATGGTGSARLSFARVRRDGGVSTPLDSTWAGYVQGVAASPDGTRTAAAVELGTWDIQVRDLRTGATSRIAIPAEVTSVPAFSADGRTIFFAANNAEVGDIYQAAVGSASPPRRLVRDTVLNVNSPAPSPDGRTLYYVRFRGGRSDIYAHALDKPASADRAVIATAARESSPSPSPDGRWLAYVSDESGRREVYIKSTNPLRSERWQVSTDGGTEPRWSKDGRELFYVGRDSLMTADVTSGDELAVRSRHALFSLARFNTRGRGYDVLPDGFLMLERRDTGPAPLRLVFIDRWQALLGAGQAHP
ncbi:MAG TPA: protein kinase [Gemmatimonadaceae bacterium]|nr:protein kinase [Gemmatimonadaceae bacterium]